MAFQHLVYETSSKADFDKGGVALKAILGTYSFNSKSMRFAGFQTWLNCLLIFSKR